MRRRRGMAKKTGDYERDLHQELIEITQKDRPPGARAEFAHE